MDPVSLGLGATTIANVGAGASAAGGITSAIGAILGGNAQASTYKYQSGVALINKQIALQNADYSRKVGEVEAQQSGMKTAAQISSTKSIQSASGIDVNSGSHVGVRDSEEEIGQLDESIIRSNAAKKAYGYEVEASKDEAESKVLDSASSKSKMAGYLSAFGSVLGAAGSVSSKWLQASQVGIGSSTGTSLYKEDDH